MKLHKLVFVIAALTMLASLPILLIGCGEDDAEPQNNTLTVSTTAITIPAAGGSSEFSLETDAASWNIENPASWITVAPASGSTSQADITVSVTTQTGEARSATLSVSAGNAPAREIVVSQAASEIDYSITADIENYAFGKAAGTFQLTVTTDAPEWQISSGQGWVTADPTAGTAGETIVTISAAENNESSERTALLTIAAPFAADFQVTINQSASIYPAYNIDPLPADQTGMTRTATEIAAEMGLGWNIGNSLEVPSGETGWGNPLVSKATIDLVKANGFKTIRIPSAWDNRLENESTAKISTAWLERVEEVIGYCRDNDMYVILNAHWDGGWLENNVTPEAQEAVNAKQKAYWEQIATYFRDYNDYLLFASANEPHVENAGQMDVLNSYHQTFIDAVRSTGGKNSYRTLIVQGPSTDIEKTNNLMTTLPEDPAENRLMAEIHYYTPWNFCGLTEDVSWGSMFFYWGNGHHSDTNPERNATWGEEETLDMLFALMKEQFVDQGIPVILGEFGAVRRSWLRGKPLEDHLASRAYFYEYVVRQSLANGLVPVYWDNGAMGDNTMALFNRVNNTVFDQQALDGLLKGLE